MSNESTSGGFFLEHSEASALEELLARCEDESAKKRAHVLLLYDAGRNTREIADEVGLSKGRVLHWRREYLKSGVRIFDRNPRAIPFVQSLIADAFQNVESGDGSAHIDETTPAKPRLDLSDPDLYLNRELSLLEFQRRVLDEAKDPTNPLLERLKFLGIVGSNLDEFYMVRVGGLKMQIAGGVSDKTPDGHTPAEQLAEIRRVAHGLMKESLECLRNEVLPSLREEGIFVLDYEELTEKQRLHVGNYFDEYIFPVLTPMAVDPGHPFPHISNLSLNLAIVVRDRTGRTHFARLKVPGSTSRFIPIKKSSGGRKKDGTAPKEHYFVWAEQVIAANLGVLFPGMEILESHAFRVTRNADTAIQELEASDLLESVEQSVRQRRFGTIVRITVNPSISVRIRDILADNMRIDRNDGYILDGPLGLHNLMGLSASIDRPDLKEKPFLPATPPELAINGKDGNIFAAIEKRNHLLQQPYDSFDPVVEFLETAATDPEVLAIKMTLYRVGRDAPVVKALLKAREYGKQVTALVELKARFDEESNIGWARMLEEQGVHVIYGLLGLKTHSKIALVVRKEGKHIRRYVHLSTGNYNAVTAHLYEDIGFFTADPDVGADATDLFNYLTGYSSKTDYRKLIVAPINLRARVKAFIDEEVERAKAGQPARIVMKTNSLVDKGMIKRLYRASQAGVEVDLIVRGICCLRPGLPGLSENIRVRSVVGRFLEHSRIYYFYNAGQSRLYLGSADMMPRNIDRRVELLFPIEQPNLVEKVREILDVYLSDNVKARRMLASGAYERVPNDGSSVEVNAQEVFLQQRFL